MEADELQTISAMVEESSKTNESLGQFVDEAARCPANILRHKSIDECEGAAMPDLHEQSGGGAAAEVTKSRTPRDLTTVIQLTQMMLRRLRKV